MGWFELFGVCHWDDVLWKERLMDFNTVLVDIGLINPVRGSLGNLEAGGQLCRSGKGKEGKLSGAHFGWVSEY
jgi:hypothetical protein